jgi:glycosyltransferase involved in cell wall biosynthesis
MQASLILPSLNRPEKLVATIENLYNTTSKLKVEIIVVLDKDDKTSQERMKDFHPYILVPSKGPIFAWNEGAKISKGEWLYIASDDVIHPPDWLEIALNTKNTGFVSLPDQGSRRREFDPFYIATRDWLKTYQNGVLAVPHYKHWGIDPEIAGRAFLHNQFVRSPINVEHNHFLFNKSERDSTYDKAALHYKRDLEIFYQRQSMAFPDDFVGYL